MTDKQLIKQTLSQYKQLLANTDMLPVGLIAASKKGDKQLFHNPNVSLNDILTLLEDLTARVKDTIKEAANN